MKERFILAHGLKVQCHTHPDISRDGLDWPLRNEERTVACTGKLGLEREKGLSDGETSAARRLSVFMRIVQGGEVIACS